MLKKCLLFCLCLLLIMPAAFAQEDEIALPETFTSDDESITLNLPEGWAAEATAFADFSFLFIANSQPLLERAVNDDDTVAAGDVLLIVVPLNLFTETLEIPDSETDPQEQLELVLANLDNEDAVVGEVEAVELLDKTFHRAYVSDDESEGAVYLLNFEDNPMVAVSFTAPGEFEGVEPTVIAILDSLVITVPEEKSFTSQSGQTSFTLPGEWVVLEVMDGGVSVTNYMPESFSTDLEPGQLYFNMVEPEGLEAWGVLDFADAQEAFDTYVRLLSAGMDYTIGEPTEVVLGDNTFQHVTLEGENEEGFFALLVVNETPLIIHVRVPAGETADFEAGIMQILETLVFTPAAEE